MKLTSLFLLIAVPAFAQVYTEREIQLDVPSIHANKVIQRKELERTNYPVNTLVFGGFVDSAKVNIDLSTGDVKYTVADVDIAAEVFWNSILKLGAVSDAVAADGAGIGSSKSGDIVVVGGEITSDSKSVVLSGKGIWISISLVDGKVTWKAGFVPGKDAQLFWDAVVVGFPQIKEAVIAAKNKVTPPSLPK